MSTNGHYKAQIKKDKRYIFKTEKWQAKVFIDISLDRLNKPAMSNLLVIQCSSL